MKRILLAMCLFIYTVISIQAQVPSSVTSIWPTHNLDQRPLENKTHEYTIGLSGGSPTYVGVTCENGVFEINNSSSYTTTVSNSFSLKIKWGKAGVGKITAVSSGNYKATYGVNIEKPQVSISGPTTVKYNDYAEYKLSFNPNMTIKSLKWDKSAEFESIGSTDDLTYKVRLIRNTAKTVNNAISVTAKTDYGDMSANLSVTLKPVFIITPNNSIVCNGNSITYSITSISGTSITWQAGSNLTLVSGQGTTTATFKSSGNGKAVAKATVTYDGQSYSLENSDVWVGVPPKTAPLTLSPTVGCGTQATFRIPNSMPEGAFNETSVNWKSSVTPSSKTKTDLKVFAKYAGSIIDVSMDLTNKCGTSRSNTATIVVTGNCGTIDPERPGKPGQPGLDPELRAKNNFRLNSYLPITSVKVYVYPTGSLVYKKKNVVNFDIQSTTLGEGIYILEITDQEGNVTREKVMKSKQ